MAGGGCGAVRFCSAIAGPHACRSVVAPWVGLARGLGMASGLGLLARLLLGSARCHRRGTAGGCRAAACRCRSRVGTRLLARRHLGGWVLAMRRNRLPLVCRPRVGAGTGGDGRHKAPKAGYDGWGAVPASRLLLPQRGPHLIGPRNRGYRAVPCAFQGGGDIGVTRCVDGLIAGQDPREE